jgi:hypothetical protein
MAAEGACGPRSLRSLGRAETGVARGAGMLEAETRFRKVEGYRGLAQLAVHVEADLIKRRNQLHAELTPPANL